jgi:hypothetical protein
MWHLYFDGEPELVAHICDLHREIGQRLSCPDQDEAGDCAHVQTQACDCSPRGSCAVCPDAVEMAA